jgi:hypothetical protein
MPNLGIRMLMHLAQPVAHVHVVEIDADDAPALPRRRARAASCSGGSCWR